MNYAESARFLYALAPRGISLGLSRVQKALSLRGSPQLACPAIIVAGTNGKGSVSAMLSSVLTAAGYKVGLYTSPHLHRLVERFRIDGKPVSTRDFARRVTDLAPFLASASAPELTFFEACTLLAFEIFRDARCDVIVLEVGLGGRLDATNVVTPLLSIITSIAMDHADRLGPTLAHIAREKAGIIKRGVPVVVGTREPVALRVIRTRARKLSSPCLEIDRDFSGQTGAQGFTVQHGSRRFGPVRLPLAGAYQGDNLACVVAAVSLLRARRFKLSDDALRKGLRRVRWPGRLELVRKQPDVLFDAAHNPAACVALAAELARLRPRYAKLVLLFGVLGDKDHREMLALLCPHVDALVFATPDSSRARPARELGKGRVINQPLAAYAHARKQAGKSGLVIVAGSIVLMAAVRAHVLGKPSDPPIAM